MWPFAGFVAILRKQTSFSAEISHHWKKKKKTGNGMFHFPEDRGFDPCWICLLLRYQPNRWRWEGKNSKNNLTVNSFQLGKGEMWVYNGVLETKHLDTYMNLHFYWRRAVGRAVKFYLQSAENRCKDKLRTKEWWPEWEKGEKTRKSLWRQGDPVLHTDGGLGNLHWNIKCTVYWWVNKLQ